MSASAKTYWKSLEQRANDPRVREFLEREFPRNASEPPDGISRRTLLTLLGASLSMAGLAACRRPVEKIVPYVSAPEEIIPGVPQHYATTMPQGLSAYGLVVETHEARPTKIEGNELHPSSLGSSNAVMQAAILGLYDPDRSPSVRHGVEKKTWADFVTAWRGIEQGLQGRSGAGLALLSESFSSPTKLRLVQALLRRFPAARWAVYEPVSDENILAGVELAAGRPYRPVHHFDRAAVIVSLDADFLLTESENVRSARGFADGRRVGSGSDAMSRLYAVEGTASLTGGNADHRLRLSSGQVGAFVSMLAAEIEANGLALDLPAGGAPEALAGVDRRWLSALARDLLANRGRGLIVAGRRQPPAVHAAVLTLNSALGHVGRTVTYRALADAAPPRRGELENLVTTMREGSVTTLVIVGGNPVYDAPADLEFAEALAGVEQVVHLGHYVDETSRRATWHLPRAHFLEAWDDARAADGTLSVVQPLIAPLYGGRSSVELLGLMASGEETSGYELVRESWRPLLGTDFEKRWSRVLHDGLLEGSALPEVDPQARRGLPAALFAPDPPRPSSGDLELVFEASPALFDGRYANNGWLCELPDPVTKLTWDNAALLGPDTARELGVNNEDLVRLSYGDRRLELPVWIVPGHADHSVSLHLGYGREAAGRLGTGRGFNAYALRSSDAPDFGLGLTIEKIDGVFPLAVTQDHHTVDKLGIETRAERVPVLIREASLEEYRHHPDFAKEVVEHPPLKSIFPDHSYETGHQWGMTIDLNVCTGCNACVTACQSENNVPIVGKQQVSKGREMHWIRVDRYFTGEPADPQTVFQPVPCMHCENAPCEQVCPVAATVHDAEGLNTMVYNRCIGTRYCSNNCPYKVRRFNYYNFTKDTPELEKMAANPDVTVRSRGVMEKCTYCTQRINAAKIDAKLAGRKLEDGDIRTACEQACPTRAITFGDIRDPRSRVSRMKRQPRDYTMLAELNNRPRTTYLAKLRNPHPELARS